MARSGTGIGYTPSQTSTSMPGSFDEEQMAIARKRLMLQQLANQAPVDSGYKGSHWVNPYLGQLGSAITGAFAQNEQTGLDAKAQDIAQRRGAAADEWLGQMPQDTPAVPEQVGTGPIAPPPGTPGVGQSSMPMIPGATPPQQAQDATINMETGAPTALAGTQMQPMQAAPDAPMVPQAPQDFVPNRAATPMIPTKIGDMAKWAAKGAAFSPMHAKVAEKALDTAIAAPERARLAAEAITAKKDTAAELASTRKHELTMKQMEGASEKERERLFKVSMAEYKQQNDLEKMAQMYEFREALKAAGGGGGGKAQQSQYMDSTGTPLVFTNGVYTRAGDGQPPVGQLPRVARRRRVRARSVPQIKPSLAARWH